LTQGGGGREKRDLEKEESEKATIIDSSPTETQYFMDHWGGFSPGEKRGENEERGQGIDDRRCNAGLKQKTHQKERPENQKTKNRLEKGGVRRNRQEK